MAKKKKFEKVTEFTYADEYGNIINHKMTGDTGGHKASEVYNRAPAMAEVGKSTQTIRPLDTVKDVRTVDTVSEAKKNLEEADEKYDSTLKKYQESLSEQIKKTGEDYRTKFDDTKDKKISYQTKEKDNLPSKPKAIPMAEAAKNVPQEIKDEHQNAFDEWKIANYQHNLAKANSEESTLWDKTLGVPIRAVQDLVSPLTTGEENILVDEKGNKTFLPSYSELKQEKVSSDYGDGVIGTASKLAGDIVYGGTKQLAAQGINAVTGGIGGSALYWADMGTDTYKNVKNQGYSDKQSASKAITDTAVQFALSEFLGGATSRLTGGKFFGKESAGALEKTLSKKIGKVVSNPTAQKIIASSSAEAIEEGLEDWAGLLTDRVTLNKKISLKDVEDTFKQSLYSMAAGFGTAGFVEGAAANLSSNNALQKVQSLNEVEKEALTAVTQKRLSGEQLDQNDIATIGAINNKPVDVNTQAQNTVQQIQTAVDNGDMTVEEANNQMQNINNQLQQTQNIEQPSVDNNLQETENIQPQQETTQIDDKAKRYDDLSKTNKVEYFKKGNGDVRVYMIDSNNNLVNEVDLNNVDQAVSELGENLGTQVFNTATDTNQNINIGNDINNQGKETDYFMTHRPTESNITADDLTKEGEEMSMPKDIYEHPEYYFDTSKDYTKESVDVLNKIRNNPDAEITIYRATPGDKINKGDWVTLSKKYAEQHNESQLEGKGNIVEMKVKPTDIQFSGDEINEWGYYPSNENLAEEKAKEPVIKIETTGEKGKQYWEEQGANKKAAEILSEMPKPEKKTIREKIKEGKAKLSEEWGYFKRNIVDKGETIYKISKKTKNPTLYAKYDKRGTTTGEANYDIGKGQTDLDGKKYKNFTDKNGKKTSMSLNQIWEGVDTEAANKYLAHWLNVDRYGQINDEGMGKYVFGTDEITPEISKQEIAKLEEEHPELKRFGENVWQYGKNQLQNMVEAGQISKEQAQQFLEDTPHYVRLQRNVETKTDSPLKFDDRGRAKVNKEIQEFKGSDIDILPFKESMAQYTLDVRNSIRNNIFAQELAKTTGLSGTNEQVDSIDDIVSTNDELIKDNGDGSYSLTFFNEGVPTTIPIDEGIYESLQPNKHYKFEETAPFKGIRKVDNIRKALLTDKNPLFLATNMMKDAFDAPLNSKYPGSFAKNYLKAFKEVVLQKGKGTNYEQYQALGGLQNSYFENKSFQKEESKVSPLGWLEKANNAVEQLPRLAEFISTMEKTGDVNQAMYNAAEITTNFKRGGDVSKAANRNGATFLNASIQGFSKQVRNFTDAFDIVDGKVTVDAKQAVQLLGKALVLGITPGLLNDMMWDDDDEYKEMQDYQKDRYYLFKGKDGEWVRIPKGRAVSVFQSAARRAKYALTGQKDAFKGFGEFASGQTAPNNPFENNIISPFVDVARNKSWSGNPIVSDSIKNETHPEEEYTIKTDEFSKWLGGKLKKSPAKINYLIDQYSGAIGDVVLPNITKKSTSKSDNVVENTLLKPVKDKFTTNAVTSSKNQNDFYEALSKAEDNKKWSKGTEEDKAIYKYLYNKNAEISEIRKKSVEIQESNASNKEKYDKVMEYTKQINKISKEAVETSKKVKKPSKNEYVIGDNHYVVSNGKVNAIKDETVQKAKEIGLSVGDYTDVVSHYGSIKADKDSDGNTVPGSKKQKFIDYVNAKEELTKQQKIDIIKKYYKKYIG